MSARMDIALARLNEVLTAPTPRRGRPAEAMHVKAITVAVDRSEFDAVIASDQLDRDRDVLPAATMLAALQRWTPTGKLLPLAWNHSREAEDIIGHIDPRSAKAIDGEVAVSGWVDRSTPRGREAWRLIRNGVMGFSFGYMVAKSTKRPDGVRVLEDIDLFEISATTTPVQGRTRVLAWKGVEPALTLAARERRLEILARARQQVRWFEHEQQDEQAAALACEFGMFE